MIISYVQKHSIFLEVLFVFVLSSLLFFYKLDQGSLADTDEAIYARVAQEMVQTQDIGTLNYMENPWFHKPPLFFYLSAAVFKVFGFSTLTSRMIPVVFAIGVVLLTYALCYEIYGHRAAFLSSLILLSSPQFVHQSRMMMLDVPLLFFFVLAVYSFVKARTNPLFYYLCAVSFGLGFLIKGPFMAGALFPIAAYFYVMRRAYAIRKKDFLLCCVIFALLITPWHFFQVALHGADFVKNYFGYHIFSRLKQPLEGHDYGTWYYLKVLWYGFWGWNLVAGAGLLALFYSAKEKRSHVFVLIWVVSVFAIVFIIQTKLPWYVLPVYPALAMTSGFVLDRITFNKKPIGFVLGLFLFAFFFRFYEPFYCNEDLRAISEALGNNMLVHVSVYNSPGEVLYFGYDRVGDNALVHSPFPFVVNARGTDTVFQNKKEVAVLNEYHVYSQRKYDELLSVEHIQDDDIRRCYAFFPGNVGAVDL